MFWMTIIFALFGVNGSRIADRFHVAPPPDGFQKSAVPFGKYIVTYRFFGPAAAAARAVLGASVSRNGSASATPVPLRMLRRVQVLEFIACSFSETTTRGPGGVEGQKGINSLRAMGAGRAQRMHRGALARARGAKHAGSPLVIARASRRD